jgi:hypothetical protein
VHKQGVMLRTPGCPWSSRRRPCTLAQRPAAVRVVAQPDRQGQLGKADRGRVALMGWWAQHASRSCSGAQSREQIQGTKSTQKTPSLSLASPSPAPPPPATATCRGQARLCAPEPYEP